jgi:hypothetical protein
MLGNQVLLTACVTSPALLDFDCFVWSLVWEGSLSAIQGFFVFLTVPFLSHSTLFSDAFFQDRFSQTICPGWL